MIRSQSQKNRGGSIAPRASFPDLPMRPKSPWGRWRAPEANLRSGTPSHPSHLCASSRQSPKHPWPKYTYQQLVASSGSYIFPVCEQAPCWWWQSHFHASAFARDRPISDFVEYSESDDAGVWLWTSPGSVSLLKKTESITFQDALKTKRETENLESLEVWNEWEIADRISAVGSWQRGWRHLPWLPLILASCGIHYNGLGKND
jgi:hypothetical protein